jgi:uncharacterized membrane protein YhaH (DUF805 family)
VKGTRLWQNTGSPLISGRSRRERPFWWVWLGGTVVATVLAGAAAYLLFAAGVDDPVTALATLGPAVVGGAAAGAAALGWFARKMGWRRAWVAGAIAGTLLGVLAASFVAGW